ncbi:MAG: LuxR C-terminal-related transcriptional regulator [Tannerellaceae bacterium]
MLLESLYGNSKFKETPNQMYLDSQISNITALACVEQKTVMIIDHFSRATHIANYNTSVSSMFGNNKSGVLSLELNIDMCVDDQKILTRYFKIINDYLADKKKLEERYVYFSILYTPTFSSHERYVFKVVPYVYTETIDLALTLCFLENSNHKSRTMLLLHKIHEDKTMIYSQTYKKFVNNEKMILTSDEVEILRMSGNGTKEQEIAEMLHTNLSSLKRCKSIIFEKLKVKSISEAIYVAYKQDLL